MRRTFEEQHLGQPLDIVLRKLTERVPSMDVQFFVSAVLLQRRTGGNLAELLDKLAQLVRERFKLRARIRTVSAQGVMSGRILSAIPVAVGGMMFMANPKYARFFIDDPTGNQMLAAAMGMQVLGYLIIKKIVTIEV
jgi:tight adherence protein B